jgi:hypothetical protein
MGPRLLVVLLGAIVCLSLESGVSAQEPDAAVKIDGRIVRVGVPFFVEASGLEGCAGQLVETGLVYADGAEYLVGDARVGADGRTFSQWHPAIPATGLTAVVRGNCVDGPVASDTMLHVVDPEPYWGSAHEVAPDEVDFRWGEEPRPHPSTTERHLMTVQISGLEECAGEMVEAGFFAGLWGPDTYAGVRIAEDGTATFQLRPLEAAGDQRAGVIGDCVAGGYALTGWSLQVAQRLPDDFPVFQLVVPKDVLEQPVPASDQDDYENLAELFGHLAFYADGQECGTLDLVNPDVITENGGALYELGRDGQHPYCETTMALVTVVDRNGYTLHEKWTLNPGERVVLDNLAPEPPHGAATQVVVPVFLAEYEGTAERYPSITVLADGQVCGVISLVDPEHVDQQGNIVFSPGSGNQPSACGETGALVSFKDTNGTTLAATFRLDPGKTYLLRTLSIPPPGDPGPEVTPVAPTAGTGFRDPETTYAKGVAAMGLVLGMAVGGTLMAARLRSRRIET